MKMQKQKQGNGVGKSPAPKNVSTKNIEEDTAVNAST